ncbi:MAG: anhydro-N-acetylmuramic acid kinase [Pirellulaceae bacterium]
MPEAMPIRSIGLMSGTSADGVDAALVETDGGQQVRFIAARTRPYANRLRRALLEAAQGDVPLVDLLRLERELTLAHADLVAELRQSSADAAGPVDVIGFHGHTVRHLPAERLTLQIGDASLLAERAGVPVVADFRRRDLAAGGQGAPLAALFHRALLADQPKPVMVLNLGGVANLTWIGRRGQIVAGDTGPGCGLLDAWVQGTVGQPYDRDGQLARGGSVDWPAVGRALEAPYFSRPLPKSADRYEFAFAAAADLSPADGAATLCAVTAEAVWRAARQLPEIAPVLWLTGGGAHHPVLVEMLERRFGTVGSVAQLGLRPDTMEAECFAWLAARRLRNWSLTQPSTTGCRRATCGGLLTT